MKRALVLSGGGAKGAFQFGAIKYIRENVQPSVAGFDYSIMAGVSVGALNAVMLAMDKYDALKSIWESISNDQVYCGKINVWALIRILFGRNSILCNAPLKEKLRKNISLAEVKKEKYDLLIGAVSLLNGEYKVFRPAEFDSDDDFRKAILASTAIPVIWEPVNNIRLSNGEVFQDAVDGGIRNVSPLGDVLGVLDENDSEVIIINCSRLSVGLKPSPDAAKNILQIAKRSLAEITINEIFNSDVREFLTINTLVQQAKGEGVTLKKPDGTPYRAFRTILIEPEEDLGDTLDFSRDATNSRIGAGYEAARQAFAGYI